MYYYLIRRSFLDDEITDFGDDDDSGRDCNEINCGTFNSFFATKDFFGTQYKITQHYLVYTTKKLSNTVLNSVNVGRWPKLPFFNHLQTPFSA